MFEDFGKIKPALVKRLAEWGSDDEDEESGGGKTLPESKKKKLLKAESWQRDARLVELGEWLREHVGDVQFDDYNEFDAVVDAKIKELEHKVTASELKIVVRGVSWQDETAPPVIAKASQPNKKGETKVDADPMRGRHRWDELPACLQPSDGRQDAYPDGTVVEFEPDPDLRDSEQIPLLDEGGIEAFITREVLPYTPDAWLGDVPEHWELQRAKYLFRKVDERSSSGNEELLSVSHITGVTPRSQKNITMFMARSYVGHKVCQPSDLVINTMWAWMAALGVSRHTGIVSPAYAVYRPRTGKITDVYLDMLLRVPVPICVDPGHEQAEPSSRERIQEMSATSRRQA